MNGLSKERKRYYVEKLFYSIDRLFNKENIYKKMGERERLIYDLAKKQFVESVVAWWKFENLKPLMFDPIDSIEKAKQISLNGKYVDKILKQENMETKLLEIALVHMVIAPNIFNLDRTDSILENYNLHEKYINVIKANAKYLTQLAYKYSSLKESENE